MSNPHDEIQCEEFYGDEPPYEELEELDDLEDPDWDEEEEFDEEWHDDDIDHRDHPEDAWVLADGSTGPAGERFLASLTAEDFV